VRISCSAFVPCSSFKGIYKGKVNIILKNRGRGAVKKTQHAAKNKGRIWDKGQVKSVELMMRSDGGGNRSRSPGSTRVTPVWGLGEAGTDYRKNIPIKAVRRAPLQEEVRPVGVVGKVFVDRCRRAGIEKQKGEGEDTSRCHTPHG